MKGWLTPCRYRWRRALQTVRHAGRGSITYATPPCVPRSSHPHGQVEGDILSLQRDRPPLDLSNSHDRSLSVHIGFDVSAVLIEKVAGSGCNAAIWMLSPVRLSRHSSWRRGMRGIQGRKPVRWGSPDPDCGRLSICSRSCWLGKLGPPAMDGQLWALGSLLRDRRLPTDTCNIQQQVSSLPGNPWKNGRQDRTHRRRRPERLPPAQRVACRPRRKGGDSCYSETAQARLGRRRCLAGGSFMTLFRLLSALLATLVCAVHCELRATLSHD